MKIKLEVVTNLKLKQLPKKCSIIGDINIDIITPPFTLPEDESSCVLDEFTNSLGGNAINVAASLAALGTNHEFFGAMGDGPISQWIIKRCAELNVNMNLTTIPNKSAGITFAMTYLGGRRQFVATLGTNKFLSEKHIDKKKIYESDHLHRSGFWYTPALKGAPTISLMKEMIKLGKETSLDVGWDPENYPQENIELLYETLEYTKYFFVNEKEIKVITQKKELSAAIDEILQISTNIDEPVVVLHQGALGSSIITKENKIKIPTLDVPQINPTGTGDIYNAGFINGLLNDWNYEKCGIFADKLACIHLMDKSKIYPTLNDIE